MIQVSRIDRSYSIFKHRPVYVWGCGYWGKKTVALLEELEIEMVGFCDNNTHLWGSTVEGKPVYSPSGMQKIVETTPEVLLVLGVGMEHMSSVMTVVSLLGEVESLSVHEILHMKEVFHMEDFFLQHPEISHYDKQEWMDLPVPTTKRFFRRHISSSENPIFICQPSKTGDYTIMATLENAGIPYYPMWHKSDLFDGDLVKSLGDSTTIKVITAVREPIIRCLSDLYHAITDYDFFPQELSEKSKGHSFFQEGGDVQALFDCFVKAGGGTHSLTGRWAGTSEKGSFYQQYFALYEEHIADLRQVPFHQEKGYAVVKQGNLEIFVYQLEKLNFLVEELSEFVGKPLEKLTNSNEAKDKWIARSYDIAKKEIKISQEFFDASFSDPYVTHFYSAKDIAGFKEKWAKHIK